MAIQITFMQPTLSGISSYRLSAFEKRSATHIYNVSMATFHVTCAQSLNFYLFSMWTKVSKLMSLDFPSTLIQTRHLWTKIKTSYMLPENIPLSLHLNTLYLVPSIYHINIQSMTQPTPQQQSIHVTEQFQVLPTICRNSQIYVSHRKTNEYAVINYSMKHYCQNKIKSIQQERHVRYVL